jgi:hypothetical protein
VLRRHEVDDLTRGFERRAARNMHRMPLAIARLRAVRRQTAQLDTYDAALTPTLADPAAADRIFRPARRLSKIIDRLIDWVAFTPAAERHRRTGELTATGRIGGRAAGRHDVPCRGGTRPGCCSWPTNSKKCVRERGSGDDLAIRRGQTQTRASFESSVSLRLPAGVATYPLRRAAT